MTAQAQCPQCPLCNPVGEDLIWQDDFCRVIVVNDPHYPGFCRVILNRHAPEMTDLAPLERQRMMVTVMKVEAVLREVVQPDKINLASFGNMVPHVHWHVIPRWQSDRHFPEPVWGLVQRENATLPSVDLTTLKQQITSVLSGVRES